MRQIDFKEYYIKLNCRFRLAAIDHTPVISQYNWKENNIQKVDLKCTL